MWRQIVIYDLDHYSAMEPAYIYRAKIYHVIDADAIELDVDLGFNMNTRIKFRLKDINTPEIYRNKMNIEENNRGIQARKFVKDKFQENDGWCIVVSTKMGAYGRWSGVIYFAETNVSLNQQLIDAGLADQYRVQ